MNSKLNNLITVIVSQVSEQGSFTTKTKLLKLLYLFDVEYYRVHRRTFTELNWKYFHLGPWTAEYELVLDGLVARSELTKAPSKNTDHDTVLFRTPRTVPFKDALSDFKDENILRGVLNIWANRTTAEILDYVYSQTEPIIYGQRNELLDFSLIPTESPQFYRRSSSGKTPQEINSLRQKLEDKKSARAAKKAKSSAFTSPRYDEEYWQAIETLEELAR